MDEGSYNFIPDYRPETVDNPLLWQHFLQDVLPAWLFGGECHGGQTTVYQIMGLRTRVVVIGLGLTLTAAAALWMLPAPMRAQVAALRWFVFFGPTLGLATRTTASWAVFFLCGTGVSLWMLGPAIAADTLIRRVLAAGAFVVLWIFLGVFGTAPYT